MKKFLISVKTEILKLIDGGQMRRTDVICSRRGGGFFSASASGYSKGLNLLLPGQRDDNKPMRVSPWNQYQLVDQESYTDLQLASENNQFPRGCAPFVCFGRASAGLNTSSPLKVGPTANQEVLPELLVGDQSKNHATAAEDHCHNGRNVVTKSSLKKPSAGNPVPELVDNSGRAGCPATCEDGRDELGLAERRRVQWTDGCGYELVQIREFEPSEAGSDDGLDHGNAKSCSCTVM